MDRRDFMRSLFGVAAAPLVSQIPTDIPDPWLQKHTVTPLLPVNPVSYITVMWPRGVERIFEV